MAGKIPARRARRIRLALAQRQGGRRVPLPDGTTVLVATCWWCREEAKVFGELTIDHVVPRAEGGSNHLSNLVLACPAANGRRNREWQLARRPCRARIVESWAVREQISVAIPLQIR